MELAAADNPHPPIEPFKDSDQPVLYSLPEATIARPLGASASIALAAFERVCATGRSEVLLTWPHRLNGIGILHGLAALARLPHCDTTTLTTLLFPWNRNSCMSQKQLLVDRDFVYRITLPAVVRVMSNSAHRAKGYLMAPLCQH